jgi:quercetin dioxygenase-like cupin family protein
MLSRFAEDEIILPNPTASPRREIHFLPPTTLHATTLDDAPAYWFLNTLHILLAKSQSTGGAYSLIHVTATPDFATPYHVHHIEDEAFYVLDGEFTFFCDRQKTVLGSGGYIFLPRGVPHGLKCSSEKDSRILIQVMPGTDVGFIGMMLEMAVPATERVLRNPTTPDLQRLEIVCKKNKIDILGPLPG